MATTALKRFTLADTFLPSATALQNAALIVAGSLLLAASAQLSVYLPFTPVPLTGQTFAVLLLGACLGSWRGAAAVALYLVEGLTGMPFFAAGATVATAGYLLGFMLAAAVVGWLSERGWDRSFGRAVVAMLVGELAILACGAAWLATFVGASRAIPMGVLPFLPGDLIKVLLAAGALPLAWKLLPRPQQER